MSDKTYTIYALQSPNGKLYVGQTDNWDRRMKRHQKENSSCIAIRDAIKKHGWENMKQFVLIEDLSLEQANHWEEHCISIFDCVAPQGYNLRGGGDNSLCSQITKDRMTAAGKKNWQDPEYIAKQSAALKEAVNTPEYKVKHKAACNTPEFKAKQSESGKVAQNRPEVKAKKSESVKVAMNKHESKEHTRLAAQLQHHEKRLEAAGLIPKMV